MSEPTARLQAQIGYAFDDEHLLKLALNHRSARGQSNERLEFLGDAILDTVISHQLVERFPKADEGVLSRLRAVLVKDLSLAQVARSLDMGELIALGSGEMKSGGSRRDSILADALEATLGAVFLDGGYDATQQVILRIFEKRLDELQLSDAEKDPKTRLQEWLQARGLPRPSYELLDASGPDHQRMFRVRCSIEHEALQCEREAASRRAAEQDAAAGVLRALGQ
ncbi:MAG: ribonuclease III [Pseudomonadota bacterium]